MGSLEQLNVVVFSFGFKYGTPVDVNYVIDVRFLPNPYWVDELREKTGLDAEVADYVVSSQEGQRTVAQLQDFFRFIIGQNIAAEKKTVRIGIGCTGGRHRSVAVVEKIAACLLTESVGVSVFHRDIKKDSLKETV
ncbi:RNase adapter RapZ [Desulforhopalus sp. IMCC35007]|uniref:RapZ C-terminal domain-containing protein n=1 Tax=Desulforhopalus sp. IMCC35007 TaxID=2569543 RepID=UPI0010AE6B99|nr:RNase adapter RapZ [Desulforhopalus sp. IMCC35007]TKB05662.1 hypothetical protein FCL48_24070 [Desulforhopalus sp. IMCC35007]